MRGDLAALMADYDDDSVLMTMDAAYEGRDAIQAFFTGTLGALPGLKLTGSAVNVCGEAVLCSWSGDSPAARIPQGVDSFVIRDGKIRLQTGWFTVVPK